MALSQYARDVLKIGLANRAAGNEIANAIDANAWSTAALEIVAGGAASAAFAKTLKIGDIVLQVVATSGLTKFAAVTAAGTVPAGLTLTNGDLIRALKAAPAYVKNLTVDQTNPLGYRDPTNKYL